VANNWSGIANVNNLYLFYDTSRKPQPGEVVPCLLCSKPLMVPRYEGAFDQVCPECWETYDECARVICTKCQVVVARVKPGVTDTGYHIRRRSVLHLDKCNVCATGTEQSIIIELDQWARAVGRKPGIWVPVGVELKDPRKC
jgi:hypothetical protein